MTTLEELNLLRDKYNKLYEAAEHTVLSLQNTGCEYSCGFCSLKEIIGEDNKSITSNKRDWSKFIPEKMKPEFMVPAVFIDKLLNEFNENINWTIKNIVDDSFKSHEECIEIPHDVFGKIWMNKEELSIKHCQQYYLQIGDNKYIYIEIY